MNDSITSFEIGGRKFHFYLPDTEDLIQRTLRETNAFHDLEVLADMMLRIAPGDLILDCGANIGNHAIFLAGAAEATVVALEPFQHCFDILDRNIAINDLDGRVLPINMACGSANGTGEVIPGGPTNLGQTRVATNVKGMGAEVQIIALDELELPAPVRLIKIDVEGMEADILRGAANILTRNAPVIYAEARTDEALAEISGIISPLGYTPTVRFNTTSTYRFEKQ